MSLIAKLDEELIQVHQRASDKKLVYIKGKYFERYHLAEITCDYQLMQEAKEAMYTIDLILLARTVTHIGLA